MKLRTHTAKGSFAPAEGAFTMIEIAISLGVIAFALIAIIGILPIGLQTQRDNREETLITQDARVLIEAIRGGGRDSSSDLGSFVVWVDNTPIQPRGAGIPTPDLIRLLTDGQRHRIMMKAISGSVADRGNPDFGFFYQVQNDVTTNRYELFGTRMSNQVYEVRLRFAWPVQDDNIVRDEANVYVARTMVSGLQFSNLLYAQQYFQPTNSP